ncbi:SDR family oxidoreductase [Chloroflexota bacterium]
MTTVITGSASGIGAAIRVRLEKAGEKVIGVDLKDAEVIADLSGKEGCAAAIAGVKQHCGNQLDRFVASAGLGPDTKNPWLIASINYFGAIRMLDGLFEILQRGSNPSAVIISSDAAQMAPMEDDLFVSAALNDNEAEAKRIITESGDPINAYMRSKNAVARAVRHRAVTWGSAGVRLNAVAPGPVKTPMLQRVMDNPAFADHSQSMPKPLGRIGEPEEIASVVTFLLSQEASYVHGAIYYIDGGRDARIRPDCF